MINKNTAPYAALMLRLSLGMMFIAHALMKILVFTPEGTANYFASIGAAAWMAYPVMVVELIAGVMLVLGTQTRIVAVVVLPILAATIVLVHGTNGWQFANQGGGWEYPMFLILATISLALLGDGAYSVKSLFHKTA